MINKIYKIKNDLKMSNTHIVKMSNDLKMSNDNPAKMSNDNPAKVSGDPPPIPYDVFENRYFHSDGRDDPVTDDIQVYGTHFVYESFNEDEKTMLSSNDIDERLSQRTLELIKDALKQLYTCFVEGCPIESIIKLPIKSNILKKALYKLRILSLMYLTSHKSCDDKLCEFCAFRKNNY